MKNLKTINETDNLKEAYQEAKDDGYEGVKVVSRAKLEKTGEAIEQDDGRTRFPVVMSTEELNRNGRMVVNNFIVEYYKENPVLLDSHKYDSIEHIVGRVENLKTENGQLTGEMVFNDQIKGRMAQELIENGFLKAVSIGYIPVDFTEEETDDGYITIISKAELLELSMVSVPSNRKTLLKQVESMDEKETEKVKQILKEEGRTLSAKNKSDIREAIDLLETVISRDEQEDVEEIETEDKDNDTEAESEPESEEEQEDDQDTEEEPKEAKEATKSLTADELLEKAVNDMKSERNRKLRQVAKALNDTHQGNVNEKKREVWKSLIDLM